MANENEVVLVEAARLGDLACFGKLCEQYYKPMLAIAFAVLADHQLAEDAVQEGFAKALVHLPTLKRCDRFGAWLARLCRNVALDMVRARTRDGGQAALWSVPHRANTDPVGPVVLQSLGQLKQADREVIVLRYFDNLSHAQMASVLGLSSAAVHGRLQRAKRKLGAILSKSELMEFDP